MRFEITSHTADIAETMFTSWFISRQFQYPELHQEYLNRKDGERAIDVVKRCCTKEFIDGEIEQIVRLDLPVLSSIHFTIAFFGVPIEWREQAVRSNHMEFWMQNMRSENVSNVQYRCTPTIESNRHLYEQYFDQQREAYKDLVAHGELPEKARVLIGLGATHNGSMFTTLRSLINTASKRNCWIMQNSLWGVFSKDIAAEMRRIGVPSVVFDRMFSPPCYVGKSVVSCPFGKENNARVVGDDPMPACPVYCKEKEIDYVDATKNNTPESIEELSEHYSGVWPVEFMKKAEILG